MEEFLQSIDLKNVLWRVISIALILFFAKVLVRISKRVTARVYSRRAQRLPEAKQKKAETSSSIIQSIAQYVIWFLAACGIIGELGLTSTMYSLLATAGIGGLALGIGAQSFIKDVMAGMFLLFEDQISVGDYVTISGISGTVEEIALRNTTLKGMRGELNVIPNGSIDVLTNYSRSDYLAMVDVAIAYETDVSRAADCILAEANAYALEHDNTVEPPEVLGITAFNDRGINLRLVMRVKPMTHFATERAMLARIKARFSKEGIEIPYPHLQVISRKGLAHD